MDSQRTENILLSAFTALESAHFYSAFNPSVFTIEAHVTTDADIQAIRKGEALATAFSLGLGIIVSLLIKSPIPILLTVVVDIGMITVYEHSLTLIQPSGRVTA